MHQGDPISAFLIILAQEVSFVLIEWNNHIKGLDVYGHNFLYTAHIDDSSFFFNNKKSVIEIFKILDVFSFLPGLKSNKEQCEVAGIGVKKVIKVALYRMKNINLKQTQGKLSEFIIFTTKKLKEFQNHIQKIENVLKILRMRNLTLEGKITITTLLISQIMYLAPITVLSNSAITQLNEIHKEFIRNHKRPRIKQKILINNFDKGGLKNVYILSKIICLQRSLVKRLFEKFSYMKIMSLFLIEKNFGENFKFHDILHCQNFAQEFCWTGTNFYLTILLYHRSYYLNIYDLIKISKLEIIE